MFGILGAVRVLGAEGVEVPLGGPRRRALLALLALDAGRLVSTERLVDGLYGEEPPAGVGNAVQSQVSRLRQVLPVPIEGQPAGYRLAADPGQVDAHCFQRLTERGRDALAAGDPVRAEALLREALELWRGPALADVGDAPFAAAQAVRLEELRVGAVEDRVETDLALGRHRTVVAELSELVATYPLRERLRGQLMRALHGSGRQTEALEAYDAARRELADSLGADPGPELAAVHLALLRGDPAVLPTPGTHPGTAVVASASARTGIPQADVPRGTPNRHPRDVPHAPRETDAGGHVPRGTSPVPAVTSPASRVSRAPRHQLPVLLTSFVGRDAELAQIGDRLAQQRLVTLTGPGGAGKTRLAVEAASRYAYDATFVELAGLTDGAELPQAVLGALGLREGGLLPLGARPAGPAGAAGAAGPVGFAGRAGSGAVPGDVPACVPGSGTPDLVARIAAAFEDRPLLLVLDNCEHIVADAARLAERLLTCSPRLRILATSREALNVPGESLCSIPTLALPDPGSGSTSGPGSGPGSNPGPGNNPGSASVPGSGIDREQLLASPAVRLFAERAAAVHPGFDPAADQATVDTVIRLCTALDGLPLAIELAAARLSSLSVGEIATRLGAVPEDEAPYSLGVRPDALFRLLSRGSRTAQPRQRTLRGVVDWSWELLTDDERAVLRRASVFAGGWTLAAAEAVCAGGGRIEPENVLDLVTGLVEKSLVVAQQPAGAGRVRYRMLESIRAYGAQRLAEAGETAGTLRAHTAYFLDFALTADPYLRRAEQLEWLRLLSDERDNLQAALHRGLDAGDVHSAMRLIAGLSSYWLLRGVRHEAVGPARRVLAAIGPCPPEGMEEEYALCVMAVVGTLADTGEFADHLAAATRVVEGMNRLARRFPVLTLLWAPFAGVPDAGVDTLAVLEEFLAGGEDTWYRALWHLGFGFQSWMVAADVELARTECETSLDGFRRVGDRWGVITCLNVLADLADHRGELQDAVALLGQALVLAEELDSALDMAELLCNRAAYSLRAGDYGAAAGYCERAVHLSRRAGSPETLAMAHRGLAEVARLSGDLATARELCGQALAECPVGFFSSTGIRSSVLIALGRLDVAAADPAGARAHFRAAMADDAVAMRFPHVGSAAAEAAAGLALLVDDPWRAADLLGAARALRGGPLDSPDAAASAAAVRLALGDEAYEAALAGTAELSRDEAVALLSAFVAGG